MTESRIYKHTDEETGKTHFTKVTYSIVMKDGVVTHVFNEYHHSVTKNSEVFEYFSNKYNNA